MDWVSHTSSPHPAPFRHGTEDGWESRAYGNVWQWAVLDQRVHAVRLVCEVIGEELDGKRGGIVGDGLAEAGGEDVGIGVAEAETSVLVSDVSTGK
jgi:hypothetical protein